ncbi:arylsulfatase [Planctomycetota bacterium]|nr:arylsulfatase [Planctomycetota bacterium]
MSNFDISCNQPNIIYILADDLGYGDVSCYNPDGKIHTPNLDRLAKQGKRFTNAHANSAVCTPTRYGIITGRYCWRSELKSSVIGGYTPALIENDRMTVASFLKDNGYQTACIGKWHLGMDWTQQNGEKVKDYKGFTEINNIDFNHPIENGPTTNGFDYYYGISGSLDMPPYAYIENDAVTEIPDRTTKMMGGKEFWREGWTAPNFKHVEVLEHLTDRAIDYIADQAKSRAPFFLYLPLPAPHGPILPTEKYIGASNTNLYGDFVVMMDDMIGRILDSIDNANITENTIIVFTSDNGCSPIANFKELAEADHSPSYKFRGHKADIYEGGHRIPFIVRWPAKVEADTIDNGIICLTDLLRTCSDMLDTSLPDNAGEDSFSFLPRLTDSSEDTLTRPYTVLHSFNGSFAIRMDDWKLEMCPGSGGWSFPYPGSDDEADLPLIQLYNLADDISEQHNLQHLYPDKVSIMKKQLAECIEMGRSTPGERQQNSPTDEGWPGIEWLH